jgi:NAD(P)-dependent dehydrogenase (short-subunit alcohol dehydrogenase family)
VVTLLDGKTCVVTGAGRGIGRAIAIDLAHRGANVVLCARTQSDLDETARLIGRSRGTVRVHVVDVGDFDALAALARTCTDAPAFALVNCAGILGPVGPITEIDMTRWLDTMRVNVAGTAAACAAFTPQMIAAGEGAIVNFAGGGIGGPNVQARVSAYTTSKAAVVALTESLAIELAPLVRVNAVAPGAIPTTFGREVLEVGPEIAGEALFAQTVQQQSGPVQVDALLELVAFLLDPESGDITGRFLAARWDDPATLDAVKASGSMYTMRRIDGVMFDAVATGEP